MHLLAGMGKETQAAKKGRVPAAGRDRVPGKRHGIRYKNDQGKKRLFAFLFPKKMLNTCAK
jgi:hypothetical protein